MFSMWNCFVQEGSVHHPIMILPYISLIESLQVLITSPGFVEACHSIATYACAASSSLGVVGHTLKGTDTVSPSEQPILKVLAVSPSASCYLGGGDVTRLTHQVPN